MPWACMDFAIQARTVVQAVKTADLDLEFTRLARKWSGVGVFLGSKPHYSDIDARGDGIILEGAMTDGTRALAARIYCGVERIEGDLDGRVGTFTIKWIDHHRFEIVAGTGTGQLRGMYGSGGYGTFTVDSLGGVKGLFSLDYEFAGHP